MNGIVHLIKVMLNKNYGCVLPEKFFRDRMEDEFGLCYQSNSWSFLISWNR